MCGIAGCFNLHSAIPFEELKEMTNVLSRRGPDAKGYYQNSTQKVFLGHRRLSILDLSTASDQPLHSECGRFVIVFNGEVYNFKELALKYKLNLKTSSDTEVIIQLFALIGERCIEEFNGMFSFAIYDKTEETIFLCRDRLGVKPLYLYEKDGLVLFASELKSFLAISAVSKKLVINKHAVGLFLHLGYIPQPHTIYENISKFPAGAYAVISKEGIQYNKYWTPEESISPNTVKNYTESKKELQNLLISSVEYRMISDVPFGTFLSGGTDSSLVTAIAQNISTTPIKTFSIGFKEAKYNESEHAKKIANYLNTEHEEFILSEKSAIESIESIMDYFDEPFSDSSALPTLLVSKMSSAKVKMVLTGDGGDELFMGYGSYSWAEKFSRPEIFKTRKILATICNLTGNSKYLRVGKLLNYNSSTDLRSHIFSQEQYCFTQTEVNALLSDSSSHLNNSSWIDDDQFVSRKLSAKENQALFDLKYYLKDDLLVKVDRSSMYSSIEAREPLLDYRIVEFALNLDESLKCKKGVDKYILKEILYDYIPQKLVEKPKWGFGIPLAKWLKGDLRYLIEKYLSQELVGRYGVLNKDQVKCILNRFFNGEDYLYNRIWLMIVLQKWLCKFYNNHD